MFRKLLIFKILIVLLFSFSLYSKGKVSKKRNENQARIDKARGLESKMSVLGEVLVEYMADRLSNLNDSEWRSLGFRGEKMNLLILFSRNYEKDRYSLEEFQDPLRREIYKKLSIAMGGAIEANPRLRSRIRILFFDIKKLKDKIEGQTHRIINSKLAREMGLAVPENAVYEVLLSSVNRNAGSFSIGGSIVIVETSEQLAFSGTYTIRAPEFVRTFESLPPPDMEKSKKKIESSGVKKKKLEVSNIYYLPPGAREHRPIEKGGEVEAGGKIWFEILLPGTEGYFLAYLKDTDGNSYNLFPGTRNAVVNRDYKVPDNLHNPFTEVQETTAENGRTQNLPGNKILLGGYTFDDNPGDETFYFFFTKNPYTELEAVVKEAQNVGDNIKPKTLKPRTKGIKNNEITPIGSSYDLYENELRIHFKHKKGRISR